MASVPDHSDISIQGWSHHVLCLQVYVQDILQKELANVFSVLHGEQGHLYVCGDVRMARDVATTLKKLVAAKLNLSEEQVEDYFFQLKVWELGWDPREGSRPRSHAVGTRTRAAEPGEGCPETLCNTAETGLAGLWGLDFASHSGCQLAEKSGQCAPLPYLWNESRSVCPSHSCTNAQR